MSITSGQLVLTHALRHAWAAGDLSDGAVHELSLAAGLVREHAVTPASFAGERIAATLADFPEARGAACFRFRGRVVILLDA